MKAAAAQSTPPDQTSMSDHDESPAYSPRIHTNEVLVIPWARTATTGAKRGIVSDSVNRPSLDPRTRAGLLLAIGKARGWLDDLEKGTVATFTEIAEREGRVERHVRLLAPLAFVSPKIISAIVDGRMSPDVTVTSLARGLPHSWAEQERRFDII